jgi:hypothetical protein
VTDKARQIIAMAREPDPEERNRVISELSSLDEVHDPQAEALWSEEIRRRVEALENGTANLIPWSEARAQLRAGLKPL